MRADASIVVLVGDVVIDESKLSAVLPGEIHPVAVLQGVADCVVGDGLPVVAGQFVFPVDISISSGSLSSSVTSELKDNEKKGRTNPPFLSLIFNNLYLIF